jgi:uncharacterized paraquat-inducible protein A
MALYPEDNEEDWEADDEDDDETVPCPQCQEPVHEQAERCPHCGEYLSEEDAPPQYKPWWIYVGVAICLLIMFLWIMGGM